MLLSGSDGDLAEAARVLNGPGLRVEVDRGEHYLTSPELTAIGEASGDKAALARGVELVRILSGSLALSDPHARPLRHGGIVRFKPNGGRDYPDAGTVVGRTVVGIGEVYVLSDGTQVPAVSEPSLSRTAAEAGAANPEIARVLRILGDDGLDWSALYHVYEVVLGDVDRRIVQDGWATKAEVRRFKHTANSPAALGDVARHGREETQPPSNPLSFEEAKELVQRIVRKWIVFNAPSGG